MSRYSSTLAASVISRHATMELVGSTVAGVSSPSVVLSVLTTSSLVVGSGGSSNLAAQAPQRPGRGRLLRQAKRHHVALLAAPRSPAANRSRQLAVSHTSPTQTVSEFASARGSV